MCKSSTQQNKLFHNKRRCTRKQSLHRRLFRHFGNNVIYDFAKKSIEFLKQLNGFKLKTWHDQIVIFFYFLAIPKQDKGWRKLPRCRWLSRRADLETWREGVRKYLAAPVTEPAPPPDPFNQLHFCNKSNFLLSPSIQSC